MTEETAAPSRAARRAERGGTATARSPWQRMVAWGMLLVLALGGLLGVATKAFADKGDDELGQTMSFYALSSATASFFGNSLSPDSDWTREAIWDTEVTSKPSNAGGVLGYSDKNRNDGANWISSAWTTASQTMSYSAFMSEDQTEREGMQGALMYARYGATLDGLGLDKTKAGMSLNVLPMLGGGLLWLDFIVAYGVGAAFDGLLHFFQFMNPFRLFYPAVNMVSPELAEGMVGGDTSGLPAGLAEVASFIGSFYKTLADLSWTVMVPIFFGVLAVGLFMFSSFQKNKGGVLKKFIVRLAFIGLGLPLLGSMYTSALDSLAAEEIGGGSGAADVIFSTFVDFEGWVMKNGLAIPEGVSANDAMAWNVSQSEPTDKSQQSVRNTARCINLAINRYSSAFDGCSDDAGGLSLDTSTTSGMKGKSGSHKFVTASNMIVRYMMGNTVSSSDYETMIKGAYSSMKGESDNEAMANWFKPFTEAKNSKDLNEGDPLENIANNPILVTNGVGLTAKGGTTSNEYGMTAFSSPGVTPSGCTPSKSDPTALLNCNMSPLSIYNYLNTSFQPETYTVYSSDNSTSGATREVHASVNMVGTGFVSFIYWIDAQVMLLSLIVISIGYMVGLTISNFKRTLQLISGIPFATLGAIQGIAKVIVYTFALIIELFATIFLFILVQKILIAIPNMVSTPLAALLGDGSGPDADTGMMGAKGLNILTGTPLTVVSSLISMIIIISFTMMALKLRKSIIKIVEDSSTKLVNKFMDSTAGAPAAGGKMAPAVAGGLAAGAGMAATNKMLSKNDSGGGSPSAGGIGSATGESASPIGTDGAAGPDGGGKIDVSGQVDGSEVAAPGSGEGPSIKSNGETVEEGRKVADNGLSEVPDPGKQVTAGQGDLASDAQKSLEQDKALSDAAKEKKKEGGKHALKAAGHTAVAVGAAYAGQGGMAAEHVGAAAGELGEAKASGHEAKALNSEVGRSNLDKPKGDGQQKKAEQSRQLGRTARQAGQTAGSMGGTGKGGGTTPPRAPSGGAPRAPRPSQPAQSPQPSGGGQGNQRFAPPAQQPAAPKPPKPAKHRADPAPKPPKAPKPSKPPKGGDEPSRKLL